MVDEKHEQKKHQKNLLRYKQYNFHTLLAARTRRLSFSFSGAEQDGSTYGKLLSTVHRTDF